MHDLNENIIELNDLSIGYGRGKKQTTVLEHIDVDLRKGEMVCLIGENGIGKSTLLRTIAGVQPILSGMVMIDHRNLTDYQPAELAKTISLVLTDRIFAGNLTVTDLVSLGRHPYTNWLGNLNPDDIEKTDRAMGITGCMPVKDRLISELSDGQMQKALIARALAQDAAIIILDEPTVHLDLINKISVLKLLKDLCRETGKSILLATHELEFSLQIADRAWIATKNKHLISGVPEDLVLNRNFDQLINFDTIDFNIRNGRFSIRNATTRTCNAEGDETALFWTINALHRNRWECTGEPSPVRIEVRQSEKGYNWSISAYDNKYEVTSIEKLIEILKKIK